MIAKTQLSAHSKPGFAGYAYWAAAAIATAVVAMAAVLYFSGWQYADVPETAPSFRAGCIGRFLLAAAALAYAIRWRGLRHSCESVGSGLAAVAVSVLLLSAVLRRFEADGAGLSVNVYSGVFYDPLVGFLALTISAYLIMEWWYRDRSAGIWVMPTAAIAVTVLEFELVRLSTADYLVVLRSYWHSTTVLLSVVGYVLLGIGCALALLGLARHVQKIRLRPGHGALLLLPAAQIEAWMVRANLGGFSLLVAAALLWEGWAAGMPRSEWFVSPIEPWVLATALLYGGHFSLLRLLRPGLAHTAFWVAGIYLSSLVAFVGINVGAA